MRSILITLTLSFSLLLTGCGMGNVGKSLGVGRRPWMYPVPEFTEQEKTDFGALKKVHPVLEKLQKNYLALKAMQFAYNKESWHVNATQMDAMGWSKSDIEDALFNQLYKIGWSEEQINAFKN